LAGGEQVQAVSRAYASLPFEERPRAALLAYNYGEAGAIDYFGKRYGLPKANQRPQPVWILGPARIYR